MRQLEPLLVLLVINKLNYEHGFLTTKKVGTKAALTSNSFIFLSI